MSRALPFLLLATSILMGCGGDSSTSQGGGADPLIVGMEMTYPPFEMRNADGEPDGISVRMAEDLAAALGRPLQLEDVAWDGIIPALKGGKIDIVISSMTRTEERAKTIDFSDGYVTNGLCLLVGKESAVGGVDDLRKEGAKIAVKLTTTGHLWAMENLKGAELIVLDDPASCVLEVVQGKADAFIYDQISIYNHWRAHPEKTRPILAPIREETWAIGVRKGEDALRESVNAFLTDYRESGAFGRLAERYMADEQAFFEAEGVPFIFH